MKFQALVFIMIFALGSCQSPAQTEQAKEESSESSSSPTLLWETDTLLKTVESVIYDPASNFIYTANINGHFMKKDGNGFISKLDLTGKIIEEKWVETMDAPTGLGIYNGKLYTTDIDRIVEIDIEQGKILNIYPVEGAKAFNDIAIGPDGTVYASDTGGNQIFSLKDGKTELVKDGIDTPNGLLWEGNRFLVTQWTPQSISELDLSTGELTLIGTGVNGSDGLEAAGNGTYLASGFYGEIYLLEPKMKKKLILDTREAQIKSADIDYIQSEKLLLVPTMDGNKVMAYQLEE